MRIAVVGGGYVGLVSGACCISPIGIEGPPVMLANTFAIIAGLAELSK